MAAPYRPANVNRGWWILVLLGVAAQALTIYLCHPYQDQLQGWILAIAAAPFLTFLIIGMVIAHRRDEARLTDLQNYLESRSLTFIKEPPDSIKVRLTPHFESLMVRFGLANGLAGLKWIAFNDHLLVLEHSFTTGSGKTLAVHEHTVVAWAPNAPLALASYAREPILWLRRPAFGETRAIRSQSGDEFQIGDPAFDKRWLLYGSPDTGMKFLTEPIRQSLMDSPVGETWSIGEEWAACGYRGLLDGDNMRRFLERTEQVLG